MSYKPAHFTGPFPPFRRVAGAPDSDLDGDSHGDSDDFALPPSDDNDDTPSPPLPEPIADEFDRIIPDPADVVDQNKVDNEEYLALGEEISEFGWTKLALLAYDRENEVDSDYIKDCTKENWLLSADGLLFTMDDAVIRAITTRDGNLNHLVATDPNVQKELEANEKRGPNRLPSLYVRALTHDASENYAAFTVDEAKSIARYARIYSQTHPGEEGVAFKIDRAQNSDWQKHWTRAGNRFFLQTSKTASGYGEISKQRQTDLARFAAALLKSAKQAAQHKRDRVPVMHYVGYTNDALSRKEQHETGDCSNSSWLTQCVVAIARALDLTTFIASYTVGQMADELCGPPAEMFLSRICRAYNFQGGFTVGQAGASLTSLRAETTSDEEKEEWWNWHLEWTETDPVYARRFEQEMRRRTRLHGQPIVEEREEKSKIWNAFVHRHYEQTVKYNEAVANLGGPEAERWLREVNPQIVAKFDAAYDYLARKRRDMSRL